MKFSKFSDSEMWLRESFVAAGEFDVNTSSVWATHSTRGSVADRLQGEREINRESGAVSGCRFLFQEVSDRRGCSSVHGSDLGGSHNTHTAE